MEGLLTQIKFAKKNVMKPGRVKDKSVAEKRKKIYTAWEERIKKSYTKVVGCDYKSSVAPS